MLGPPPALHWISDFRHTKVFHRLARMTPSLAIQSGLHLAPELSKTSLYVLGNVALAFTLLFMLLAFSALLSALLDIYARTEHARTRCRQPDSSKVFQRTSRSFKPIEPS